MQDPKKQQQPDDEDDTQSGQSHQKQQAGDNQGRLADGDREQQADGNQEKQHHHQEKRQVTVSLPSQCYDVIFQSDNVDKNVYVRNMRVDNQNTSLHYYFNSYAVKDRVPCSSRHAPAKGASCYNIEC